MAQQLPGNDSEPESEIDVSSKDATQLPLEAAVSQVNISLKLRAVCKQLIDHLLLT